MLHTASILLTIAVLWGAAAVAPGPNFLITTRTTLSHGRAQGLLVALGLACGAVFWGAAGFFGIHALFTLVPWLYLALKLGGAAYLTLFGIKMIVSGFRSTGGSQEPRDMPRRGNAFWPGFLTSVANPYTALSATSLFAATLPAQPPLWLGLAAIAVMSSIAIAWYGFVACVLSLRPAAETFAGMKHWIDRTAGVAFVCFGIRMATRP